jgi:hypothetical protein
MSRLLSLPAEIRLQIYHYLLPQFSAVHISARTRADKRLVHVACISPDESTGDSWMDESTGLYHSWGAAHEECRDLLRTALEAERDAVKKGTTDVVRLQNDWPSLMLVCRVM